MKHDCDCGENCDCPPLVCKNKDCKKNYAILLTAKWCQPCRKMYPRVDQMRKDGYIVYLYDVDQYLELKEKFKVDSVPTIIVMDKGREVTRFIGVTEVAEITKHLAKEADQKPIDKYNFLP